MNKIRKTIRALRKEGPVVIIYILARRGMFDWMKDEQYIRLIYWATFKRFPNLKNPKTFNEKLNYLKIHDRKPEYTRMVDKYEAKKYVAERIGEEYLIPTLGTWKRFDDIDFSRLPDQFVLKCTHDSGGLVICREKKKLDLAAAKEKIESSLKRNYFRQGREWPYKNVERRILAEEYLEDELSSSLTDYKFFCFQGEPRFLYISVGLEDHRTAQVSFMNLDWTRAPFSRADFAPYKELPPKPECMDEMIRIARKLSEGLPFLRVDMYYVKGHIYFSELTFSPCSGMLPFEPAEYDRVVGDLLKIPSKKG